MNEFFLSDNERSKLAIMEAVLRCESLSSVNAIKEMFGFSYAKSKCLVTELQTELKGYFELDFIDHQGKIDGRFSRGLVIEYRNFLIKRSVSYQFLFHYLIDPAYTFQQLCQDNFISRASVFRKLKPLKVYLARNGIKMKVAQLQLEGQEPMIRAVLFNLFWQVDRGEGLAAAIALAPPVYALSAKWCKNILLTEVGLFLSIATCRHQRNCFVTTEIFNRYHRPESPLPMKLLLREAVSSKVLENELAFLGYFFTYQTYYFDPKDARIAFLAEGYRQTETDLVTSRFLELCGPYVCIASLPPLERKLLYVNMLNTFNHFMHFRNALPVISGFDMKQKEESSLQQDSLWQLIHKLLLGMSKQPRNRWLKSCLPQLVEASMMHLAPYFNIEPPKKLRVVIKNDPNYFLLRKVFDVCQNTPFLEAVIKGETLDGNGVEAEVVLKLQAASIVAVQFRNGDGYETQYVGCDEFEEMRTLLYECYQRFSSRAQAFCGSSDSLTKVF